ncbi:GPROAR1 family protein [Megaselia abdita]
MNETECDKLIESIKWTEPSSLISLAILEFINVLVIGGNCLVIAAVFCSNKLRSVTNFFIVNLAVADLLVGLLVLPFSATWEVFKVWIFGDVWCKIWLAVDVWMCTASILNLCAISLDRYVAVTRPVTYPSIMSTKRAKSLIAGIWVLSFVICFPPLVGWKDQKMEVENLTYTRGNHTLYYADKRPHTCPWKCELTNDRGYVLYSALGSFYIPMFVMLFFYWRIYRAAVRTTRAINQGFKTTKAGSVGIGSRFDEQRLTLRIHRGRGSHQMESAHSNGSSHSSTTTLGTPSPERFSRYSTRRTQQTPSLLHTFHSHVHHANPPQHEKIKISVSYPSNENIHELAAGKAADKPEGPNPLLYAVHFTSSKNGKDSTESQLYRTTKSNNNNTTSFLKVIERSPSTEQQHQQSPTHHATDICGNRTSSKKMGKRNIKAQVKRFRMETKAAKTLAIIVGLFILCWLPFFTIYVIRPFCENCIDPLLFSILFWLGYCNSAVNPMIYALFSKDFRFAFKRIICKCFCGGQGMSQKTSSSRRGSDMSHIKLRCRTPSITPSGAAHSFGEESENDGPASASTSACR